jgi:hypothetical protein
VCANHEEKRPGALRGFIRSLLRVILLLLKRAKSRRKAKLLL